MQDNTFVNSIEAIAKGFFEIIEENRSLDQVTSFWIKQHPEWSNDSKGFFAETLIEVVRWWRLLHICVLSTFQVNTKEQYRLMVLTYLLIKKNDSNVDIFFSSSVQKNIQNCLSI